jgi:hypothetical protein
MADKKGSTELAKGNVVTIGKVRDDSAFAEFVGEGFAQVETVVFGAEEEGGRATGKCARYVGQLIGRGADIERADKEGEVRAQKTFAFHPMTRTAEGEIGVALNVTHVIPASYMMAAACDRILSEAEKNGKTAIVGMLYRGQVPTRSGFRVNDIAVFEKYV